MKRYTLSLLAWSFFVIALVAWFIEPTRRVDWIPMWAISIVLWAVNYRLKDMQRRLDKLEEPPKE
jgi:hypothetical protein